MLVNKLSNLKFYRIIYAILILSIIIIYFINFNIYSIVILSLFFLIFIILFISRSNSYRFDSTGDVIIIEIIGVSFLGLIKNRQAFIEIPKRKIIGYTVKKRVFKTKFNLNIESKRSCLGKKITSFTISFLSKQNRLNIVQELEKAIKQHNG